MALMKTGVCYYPEHWPEERWAIDAAHMRRLGLSVVRIGEFAWSRLEKSDGTLTFEWLQRAIETLHAAGLSVVLGTPTATPPRWMLEKYPDMLAVDETGHVRNFGSRRHYCFSYEPYKEECRRIVSLLAQHFGNHPALIAWQTDNEYGCHNTSISYSKHALVAFQLWCANHYENVQDLNDAWGNVFWSMEYDRFDQIGLPTLTVTECNPAHQLAFWRFSTDQIQRFNKVQVDALRQHSPGTDILHNYMGNFVEFDHHQVSQDLDIAAWDNYPLGHLTQNNADPADQDRFYRTGQPDSSAFNHDLYRGCCNGRWWVMEQQPGPVNWAPYNPSPLNGMVRLWGWEAFAHGAEVMSYFRWRQAPFAQEQAHTGLLLPNSDEDIAAVEVAQLNKELQSLPTPFSEKGGSVHSDVAIVFSYPGIAIQDIQPPGGIAYSALSFCQRVYSACRQWGVNVDIISPEAPLDTYKLIILCTLTENDSEFVNKLNATRKSHNTTIVMFPGTGSRSTEYRTPDNLAPGYFQQLLNAQLVRSESLPPGKTLTATDSAGTSCSCQEWREHISSDIPPKMYFADGWGFHYQQAGVHYINAIPEQSDLIVLMGELLLESDIPARDIGPYLRTQRIGPYRLAFNYGPQDIDLAETLGATFDFKSDTAPIVGSRIMHQAEVALWLVEE